MLSQVLIVPVSAIVSGSTRQQLRAALLATHFTSDSKSPHGFMSAPHEIEAIGMKIRLLTWNVRSLRNLYRKRVEGTPCMWENGLDVVCLTEIQASFAQLEKIEGLFETFSSFNTCLWHVCDGPKGSEACPRDLEA